MHARAALFSFVALACNVTTADNGDFPQFYSAQDPGDAVAFAEERKADFSIFYDYDGKLDIGIGVVRDGARHPITFTFDELRSFWKQQRHKTFIVVTLAKSRRTADEAQKLAARITDYFFELGFQRVRIHQASGTGVGVWSDSTNLPKNNDATSK